MRGLHFFQEGANTLRFLNTKCDFNKTFVHTSSLNQAMFAREQLVIWATYSQSTPDTQGLSLTSHQVPLPLSGCIARGETLHYNHLSRQEVGLWQLRRAIYYSIILNISRDRQDAHAIINISTVALQKEVVLHLSGIDQEGSRFTLPKKGHNSIP